MDRRLGGPLPHQLPNPTRADPSPINLSPKGRMRYYPQFPRTIPQKRARSHALLTRPPLAPKCSLDLHVLGLPPAFVLSQDQTLKLKAPSLALSLTSNLAHLSSGPERPDNHLCLSSHSEPVSRQTVKLTPGSSLSLPGRYASSSVEKQPNRPHIPSDIHQCQKAKEPKSRNKRHSHDATSGHPFPEFPQGPQTKKPASPSPSAFPPSVKRYLRRAVRSRKSLCAFFFAEPLHFS